MNRKLATGCGIALLVLLGICVVVQIPVLLFQNNPPVVREPNWDSPQTRELAQRACFDCHSNETKWPWFTRVPPGSLLAVFDTIRGRGHLNFSEWQSAQRENDTDEIGEQILRGEMPPGNYLMMHPEAVLTNEEKAQLIRGLQNSLK